MEEKLHVIERKILALKSILSQKKMVFFELEVLQYGRKSEARVNIKMVSMIPSSIKWSQKALLFKEK